MARQLEAFAVQAVSRSARTLIYAVLISLSLVMQSSAGQLSEKLYVNKLEQANNGNVQAQFNVAERLEVGKGTDKNLSFAFQWYSKAAGSGMAEAQYRMATMLEKGVGVQADPEKAWYWYEKADAQGHKKARLKINARKEAEHQAQVAKERERQAQLKKEHERQRRVEEQKRNEERQVRERTEARRQEEKRAPQSQQAAASRSVTPAPAHRNQPAPGQILATIKQGQWELNGVAPEFMPSQRAKCVQQGDTKLVCFTSETEVRISNKVVRYMVKSSITHLRGNSFSVSYLFQVTKIRGDDTTVPEYTGPNRPEPVKGWQNPAFEYQCKLASSASVQCTDSNNQLISLKMHQ